MIQIDDHIFQNGLKAQSRKVATKSYLENVISKTLHEFVVGS